MDQGLIPKRYAKALYEVAKDSADDSKVYGYMQNLLMAFDRAPGLAETMANPFVSDSDKTSLIETACMSAPGDVVISNFIKLLEQNHRVGLVRDIAAAYLKIYREQNRIARVRVVSAAPLEKESEDRLRKIILSHLDGASMEYSSAVDPDLIGGFVVNIDNQRLDASVKNELKQLRLTLLK